jgi:hypothetical protein
MLRECFDRSHSLGTSQIFVGGIVVVHQTSERGLVMCVVKYQERVDASSGDHFWQCDLVVTFLHHSYFSSF